MFRVLQMVAKSAVVGGTWVVVVGGDDLGRSVIALAVQALLTAWFIMTTGHRRRTEHQDKAVLIDALTAMSRSCAPAQRHLLLVASDPDSTAEGAEG